MCNQSYNTVVMLIETDGLTITREEVVFTSPDRHRAIEKCANLNEQYGNSEREYICFQDFDEMYTGIQ